MNPISKFENWYKEELSRSKVEIPSACCLSTIGLDGFPNARFVSFKSLINNTFIFTGSVKSRKGLELNENSKAALTFWWTETERQVRIQGTCSPLEKHLADHYFSLRNKDSQLISLAFQQGKPISNKSALHEIFNSKKKHYSDEDIPIPADWGGFKIDPLRIEFLEFEQSRLHLRELYSKKGDLWTSEILQP